MEVNEDNNIKKRLIDFFEEELQIPVSDEFIFFEDTGIDGHDAYMLMINFGSRFSIDMTTFNSDMYFTSEANLMNFPKRIFLSWFKKHQSLYFDINHLVKVVKQKRWFDMQKK